MKTDYIKASEVDKKWFLVDAENKTLGRLSSKIAQILRGKGKVNYTPHMDMGDFVIIVNAEKIKHILSIQIILEEQNFLLLN